MGYHTKFFWGNTRSQSRKHWDYWDALCFSIDEGGLGIRSLFDLNKVTMAKLWWNFRTSIDTLWSAYIGNKYYKKIYRIFVRSTGTSHIWRSMLQVTNNVKP